MMTHKIGYVFIYFLIIHSYVHCKKDETPLLLIVAYDGLRYDFLNEVLTPNLWQLAKKGVWSPNGVKNQVVTVTAPSFYTIVTGLYQENHGIIGNKFYDPVYNEFFDYWNMENETLHSTSLHPKWYSGEPIWQTNEKHGNGRISGAMRWPMCDALINNIPMKYCTPWRDYREFDEWKSDLDELLSWFLRKNDPINLGLYYISEPDHTEHENDIYSDVVRKKIAEVDALTGYMINKLKYLNLWHKMNIIFTSDHGHVNVFTRQNVIKLDDFIDPNDYFWSSKSVFPANDSKLTVHQLYRRFDEIRMSNPKFSIWYKNDVPEKFHFKNNRRIGPIVIVEHLGYVLISHFDEEGTLPPQASLESWGTHGFSTEYQEMRPIFAAIGPVFKSEYMMNDHFENIDLYNLMCYVLKINASSNDGNFNRVLPMIDQERSYKRYSFEFSQLVTRSENEPSNGASSLAIKLIIFSIVTVFVILFP